MLPVWFNLHGALTMKRRGFMGGVGAVVVSPLAAHAEHPKKLWRVAFIVAGWGPDPAARITFSKILAEPVMKTARISASTTTSLRHKPLLWRKRFRNLPRMSIYWSSQPPLAA